MDSNQDMVLGGYECVGDDINLPYCKQTESNTSTSKSQSSRLNMFPSPLTCRNIDDMEYIDHGSQIITPSQEDPDYEEIGNINNKNITKRQFKLIFCMTQCISKKTNGLFYRI